MKPKLLLKTKNLNAEYLEVARAYAKEISKYEGVIGIAVGGGIGRGHSDIDLYIYLDSETYKKWKKKSPIKEGCHDWKGFELETEFYDFECEKNKDWLIPDRWEKQHHFTLFDKGKKVENLIKRKCVWKKGEREKLLKERIHRADWYLDLHETFIFRKDIGQAHYLVNIVIDWILEIILLKNKYFIPWGKWKFHYAKLMKNKPMNFEKRIMEAMKIKEFSEKDLLRRVKIARAILKGR